MGGQNQIGRMISSFLGHPFLCYANCLSFLYQCPRVTSCKQFIAYQFTISLLFIYKYLPLYLPGKLMFELQVKKKIHCCLAICLVIHSRISVFFIMIHVVYFLYAGKVLLNILLFISLCVYFT